MIPTADRWGPFRDAIDEPERRACLRALRQTARLLAGPRAIAFRSALRRKGVEAYATGGLAALDELLHAIAEADFDRADARTAIVRAAWADLLPGLGRSACS